MASVLIKGRSFSRSRNLIFVNSVEFLITLPLKVNLLFFLLLVILVKVAVSLLSLLELIRNFIIVT